MTLTLPTYHLLGSVEIRLFEISFFEDFKKNTVIIAITAPVANAVLIRYIFVTKLVSLCVLAVVLAVVFVVSFVLLIGVKPMKVNEVTTRNITNPII